MNHSLTKAAASHSHTPAMRTVLTAVLAMIGCSAMAELIVWLVSQVCLTCIVSIALAWASQLAAFGEAPARHDTAPARTSAQVTALMGHVSARTGAPIAKATISLEEFSTRRQTSAISSADGSF